MPHFLNNINWAISNDSSSTNDSQNNNNDNELKDDNTAQDIHTNVDLETVATMQLISNDEAAENDALKVELEQLKDQLLRTLAEQENLRRRNQREKEEALRYALTNFAKEIISVADNLERALFAVKDDSDATDSPIVSGVKMVHQELLTIFQKFGINKINAVGEPFNPNLHQAVAEVESTTVAANAVVNIIQDGYTLNERLLRPAMVTVSKL